MASGWEIAGLFFRNAYARMMIASVPLRLHAFATRAPERLVAAPSDLRAVDPFVAGELVEGRILLAGKLLETAGVSPFRLVCPSPAFEERLHAFGWLRHIRAGQSAAVRLQARLLVADWMALHGQRLAGPGWTADIAAQRLIAWLSHAPVILQDAEPAFYRRFLKCLNFHLRYLNLAARYGGDGETRLRVRIALAMASLCLPHSLADIRLQGDRLEREMRRQILADGGHVSRNPRTMLELLLDLLPLRQSYITLGHDIPAGLIPAIDRLFPAIRFFRHKNGDLALFNGATATLAKELAGVLRYDETAGRPSTLLPDLHYHRLAAAETVLIVDAGFCRPAAFSGQAHGGCLSFEMSCGNNRFIVNAGFPRHANAAFKLAARSTAAHSTITLDDMSSCRFSRSRLLGPIVLAGVSAVTVERESDHEGNDRFAASHNGYAGRFGYLHRRELELNAAGTRIKGRDLIVAVKGSARRGGATRRGLPAVSRFHIHPAIRLEARDDGSVYLQAADGTAWLFSAPGLRLDIAEDVFMADASGIRPSRQIEIAFTVPQTREICWSLERKQ